MTSAPQRNHDFASWNIPPAQRQRPTGTAAPRDTSHNSVARLLTTVGYITVGMALGLEGDYFVRNAYTPEFVAENALGLFTGISVGAFWAFHTSYKAFLKTGSALHVARGLLKVAACPAVALIFSLASSSIQQNITAPIPRNRPWIMNILSGQAPAKNVPPARMPPKPAPQKRPTNG